jgi:Leucine-rich repeat (LRR) protein
MSVLRLPVSGFILGFALVCCGECAFGDETIAATPEKTLAWLKSLPTMSGSAIGPVRDRDCFQKLTVAEIGTLKELHLGGHLVKDGKFQKEHVEIPAGDFHHLTALPALEKLDLMENGVGDDALVPIGKLKTLTSLMFGDHHLTDAGLKYLTGLKKLTHLSLCWPAQKHGGKISDDGMDEIAKLTSLESLDLRATQVTDVGIGKLLGLPRLKTLELNNTAITNAGLLSLQKLGSLTKVSVFNCKHITAQGVNEFKKARPDCQVVQTAKP